MSLAIPVLDIIFYPFFLGAGFGVGFAVALVFLASIWIVMADFIDYLRYDVWFNIIKETFLKEFFTERESYR